MTCERLLWWSLFILRTVVNPVYDPNTGMNLHFHKEHNKLFRDKMQMVFSQAEK